MAQSGITVTQITNPFDPLRHRQVRYFEPGTLLQDCVDSFSFAPNPGYDVVVSLNGNLLPDGVIPKYYLGPGDSVAFLARPQGGGGKNWLGWIAMIAVAIVAPWLGSYAAGTMSAAMGWGIPMTYFAQAMFTAGFMALGGMLVNSLFPSQLPNESGLSSNFSESQTYGWNIGPNSELIGNVLPTVFGTFRIVPQVIAKYIEVVGNKQYLNALYLLVGHEIDSVSSIRINEQPMEYYTDVFVETRLGTNDQSELPYFNALRNDVSVNVQLSETLTWVTRQLSTEVDAFTVGLVAPRGIFEALADGTTGPATVLIDIDYRQIGDLAWVEWQAPHTITKNKEHTFRWSFEMTTPYAGFALYEYRVRIHEQPVPLSEWGTDRMLVNDIYVDYHQEITYLAQSYPNSALLAVRALATDQLSGGMPRIDCLVTRSTVPVWTGASYVDKPATSPAWICWHILHDSMNGGGVPYAKIVYAKFDEFDEWCTSKGIDCNIYFDSQMSLKQALDTVSGLGRAQITQMGSLFSVIMDKPDVAAQKFLFTMGNIGKDSFAEEWLSMEDRADELEVTYWDATNNYQRDTVTLYQQGFDALTGGTNKQTVMLYGCTSRAIAAIHGRFLLNKNRYLTLTASWSADIDAIACLPGDVVDVAHDVPQWGYSGRLVSAGATSAVLDRQVTMLPGTTYVLDVQMLDDTRESKSITVGVETTTDTLTVTAWSQTPDQYDLYTFGEINTQYKSFRVLEISKDSELKRKIKALEYVPEVYSDAVTIPDPIATTLGGISGLRATEIWTMASDGSGSSVVDLTWRGLQFGWQVYFRKTGDDTWNRVAFVHDTYYRVLEPVTLGSSYDFCVSRGAPDYGAETSLTIVGDLLAPEDVTGLTATMTAYGMQINWDHVPDLDRKEYILKYGSSWEGGTEFAREDSDSYLWDVRAAGDYTIWVKAIDRSGNVSVNPASVTVEVYPGNDYVVLYDEEIALDFVAGFGAAVAQPATSAGTSTSQPRIWFKLYREFGTVVLTPADLIYVSSSDYPRFVAWQDAAATDPHAYVRVTTNWQNESGTTYDAETQTWTRRVYENLGYGFHWQTYGYCASTEEWFFDIWEDKAAAPSADGYWFVHNPSSYESAQTPQTTPYRPGYGLRYTEFFSNKYKAPYRTDVVDKRAFDDSHYEQNIHFLRYAYTYETPVELMPEIDWVETDFVADSYVPIYGDNANSETPELSQFNTYYYSADSSGSKRMGCPPSFYGEGAVDVVFKSIVSIHSSVPFSGTMTANGEFNPFSFLAVKYHPTTVTQVGAAPPCVYRGGTVSGDSMQAHGCSSWDISEYNTTVTEMFDGYSWPGSIWPSPSRPITTQPATTLGNPLVLTNTYTGQQTLPITGWHVCVCSDTTSHIEIKALEMYRPSLPGIGTLTAV